jgi:CYTH domain-containing protein/predicted ATPase
MQQKSITKIVITGGPCAGKSTGMSYLSQKLEELGYKVIIVSETATEFITAGCMPGKNISLYDFEEILLKAQLTREAMYLEVAEKVTSKKVVLLFDRGAMDVKAYLDEISWGDLLEDMNVSSVSLRDKRYDAVLHLRTAALGAEKFYTQENNSARLETVLEAVEADRKTLEAWIGHPHLHVLDNSTDFEHKIKRVLHAVLGILGEPVPMEIERKYLVAPTFDYTSIPCVYQETDIEQAYLPGGYRIRKRSEGGASTYTKTHKTDTEDPSVRLEKEERVSVRVYRELMSTQLKNIPVLNKKRICFVYREQYFELDIFKDKNIIMLEIELTEAHKEVTLPEWLPIIREVTDDPTFRNFEIAKR